MTIAFPPPPPPGRCRGCFGASCGTQSTRGIGEVPDGAVSLDCLSDGVTYVVQSPLSRLKRFTGLAGNRFGFAEGVLEALPSGLDALDGEHDTDSRATNDRGPHKKLPHTAWPIHDACLYAFTSDDERRTWTGAKLYVGVPISVTVEHSVHPVRIGGPAGVPTRT